MALLSTGLQYTASSIQHPAYWYILYHNLRFCQVVIINVGLRSDSEEPRANSTGVGETGPQR